MTPITALEIFTHPNDLYISIQEVDIGAKFGFDIYRGPEHDFKPLLTLHPFARPQSATVEERFADILEEVKILLESVQAYGTKEFTERRSLASQFLNPDGLAIDQSKVVNTELIAQIINELRHSRSACTYTMQVLAH